MKGVCVQLVFACARNMRQTYCMRARRIMQKKRALNAPAIHITSAFCLVPFICFAITFYARGVYTVIKSETEGMITMQHIFDDARQGIVWIARNPLYNTAIIRHYIKAPAWCRRAVLRFFFAEMYFRV